MADLVSARAATVHEVETTASIADQASTTVRSERGGRWHLDHDRDRRIAPERHSAALASSEQYLVVGCIDEIVVGYGLAELSPAISGQICMIDELVVHPDAQGIGVGSAILAAVREWAMLHSCLAIESQVLPGNRAAKNFFERVGMKTRKMRVSADL